METGTTLRMALAVLVCTGLSPGAGGRAMYICTYSVPQSSSSICFTPQARGGERPCQSGPDPPHSAPPLPAQATWPLCDPIPPNPGDQGAESRSWVCLILLIGFNFSLASFSSSPCWGPGAERKDGFIQLFSYIPCSEWVGVSPLTLTIPSSSPCLGESLCMFSSLWWEMFD